MKKNISAIVFYGAIWGLIEATLGYTLHAIPIKVGWFFWFPLAYLFLDRVYKKTNKLSSLLYTSSIAASIKLINLLLPTRIDKVINPAASILFEGLAVFAVFKVVEHKKDIFRSKYIEALVPSIGWRFLYVIYILLMPEFFFKLSPLRAVKPFLKFFVFDGIANSLIIYAYITIAERISIKNKNSDYEKNKWLNNIAEYMDTHMALKICISFSMLALALYAEWLL
jgi:hypothetical protein